MWVVQQPLSLKAKRLGHDSLPQRSVYPKGPDTTVDSQASHSTAKHARIVAGAVREGRRSGNVASAVPKSGDG